MCVYICVFYIYILKHILTSPHLFSFFTGAKHSDSIFLYITKWSPLLCFWGQFLAFKFFFFFLIFLIYLAVGLSCGMWDLVLLKVKVKLLSRVWLFATPWTDYSPPGFSVHGIFQARILEWVAISFSSQVLKSQWWTDKTLAYTLF